MGVLTENLLDDIKDRSFAPISQNTWTDAKILRLATKEMRDFIVPEIMSKRENFFLVYTDTSLTANVSLYSVPERSVGNSLKNIFIVDSEGDYLYRLNRAKLNHIDQFEKTGTPSQFFMQGDKVRVLPSPKNTENTLRQFYFLRSSELVETSNCAKITSVSRGASNTTFTVDTDLSGSLSSGDKIDFVNGQSPYLLWAFDVEIGSITSSTIVVTNESVDDAASSTMPGIDDYICPRLQSNIPMIPEEYHTALAIKTARSMVASLNDQKKYQLLNNDLKEALEMASKLIANRIEDQPQKINPRNTILNSISEYSYFSAPRVVSGNS